MSDTYTEHQGALQDAITAVAGRPLVTHYVVVAATVDDGGEVETHLITSPNLPMWQAHGLLSFEAAHTTPQPAWATEESA